MEEVREVIIIGAGMAGIGASRVLTQHKIDHLLVDSRDRIGGRVFSSTFDGVIVEEGASFVHCPHYQGHLVSEFISKNSIPVIKAQFNTQCYFYENQNLLPQKYINKAWTVFEQFKAFALQESKKKPEDISVSETFQHFLALRQGLEEHTKNTLKWIVDIHSNIEGGDLPELSLKEYVVSECQSQHDYLPAQGYSSILKQLFKDCNPDLKLEHTVSKVDYQESQVKVYTNKGTFLSRHVICTLPLGVIQQQKVIFQPQFPQRIKETLLRMGNGIANKLLISFQTPFWGKRKGWLNFITKTKHNPYPIGYILPEKKKYILCVFMSGSYSLEASKMSDQEVLQDFISFLGKFLKEEVRVRTVRLTRWQNDLHSLGSYSFCPVGHDHQSFVKLLSHPIGKNLWLAGEYLHPELNGCAHSAFETGVKAAEEVIRSITVPL